MGHSGVSHVPGVGWGDGPHEFQGCSSQKCSRGGVGWVMQWWSGWVGHGGVG